MDDSNLDDYFKELFGNPELDRYVRESLFGGYGISSGEEMVNAINEIQVNPDSEEAWERVIEVGEATLEQVTDNPVFYFIVGAAYLQRTVGPSGLARMLASVISNQEDIDLTKAITHLKRAIEINPENTSFYFPLGLAYMQNRQDYLSIDCFEKAKEFAQAEEALSKAYMTVEDYPKAVEVLSNILQRDSGNVKALQQLSHAYEKLGELDSAITALERLTIEHPPPGYIYRNLASLCKKKGDADKAKEYVIKWMENDVELKNEPRTDENISQKLEWL